MMMPINTLNNYFLLGQGDPGFCLIDKEAPISELLKNIGKNLKQFINQTNGILENHEKDQLLSLKEEIVIFQKECKEHLECKKTTLLKFQEEIEVIKNEINNKIEELIKNIFLTEERYSQKIAKFEQETTIHKSDTNITLQELDINITDFDLINGSTPVLYGRISTATHVDPYSDEWSD